MKTIEFLGEENFLNICKKFSLKEKEIETVRKIIEKWDEASKIPDREEGLTKEGKIGFDEFLKIPQERRVKCFMALLETVSLFAESSQRRN